VIRILLATHNAHKTREFRHLFGNDFEIDHLSGAWDSPVLEETGHTFQENAILKAFAVSQVQHLLAVADDSGLEVDALGGAPGILSARYAGKNASDKDNIDKLLRELARVDPIGKQRGARFRCVLALAREGRLLKTFEGLIAGKIADAPRGTSGFGYDPIFVPDGFDQTFAELPEETKNRISHRAQAVRQAIPFLRAARR
jgi:XTP/dITP diphosphohydrolase